MTNLEEVWFRPYVWTDYRLALLFNLIIPIVLTIWAFVQRVDCIQRLLAIYWRVASLAAITVYLMIGGFAVSFISGLIARILIPLSIWFWVDLNDEVEYQSPGALKLVFTSWRWAITLYGTLGAIGTVPFLGCAFSSDSRNSAYCKVWTEAPLMFKDYFHHNSTPGFLGFLGIVGLIIYIIYLTYFVLVKFGKYGRTAVH
ncbi:DUF3177 family protein [Cylindrospermopsis raciborskii LB2897]|jgi:hypothetical protein|uniref:DUF3177 family protein n=1 Tax=Cylindrospermopsis raciborskii TaxID=77022 RepID=UPI001454C26B|nr:DUF3177 family protein [Cylindrospermopsis raciborskii]MBG0744331.1 DUF3177 family protein [Cylindrospermopsis raciborskii KL1]NLQ06808.1 DUF3177 family protein [Cylindrospermopsis raciborskii LB2897]